MISIKTVDRAIAATGGKERLFKGNGYFYFAEGTADAWPDSSVAAVTSINQLTLAQWMEEYESKKVAYTDHLKATDHTRKGKIMIKKATVIPSPDKVTSSKTDVFAASLKKGVRVIANFGTAKEPEYYAGAITKNNPAAGTVNMKFDDGHPEVYPAKRSKTGLIGLAIAKTRKTQIPAADLAKWLLPDNPAARPAKPVKPKPERVAPVAKLPGTHTPTPATRRVKYSKYQPGGEIQLQFHSPIVEKAWRTIISADDKAQMVTYKGSHGPRTVPMTSVLDVRMPGEMWPSRKPLPGLMELAQRIGKTCVDFNAHGYTLLDEGDTLKGSRQITLVPGPLIKEVDLPGLRKDLAELSTKEFTVELRSKPKTTVGYARNITELSY